MDEPRINKIKISTIKKKNRALEEIIFFCARNKRNVQKFSGSPLRPDSFFV